ncbi:MAG: 5-formyltetrahydrofolate cyclo-ligase [Gammaproteobacteria bacterium]
MPSENTVLRNELKARRLALDTYAVHNASAAIIAKLWGLPELARFQSIAVYMAANGEINCDPFIRQGWRRKKKIYVPVLRNSRMLFSRLTSKSKLRENRFGIPEPDGSSSSLLAAAKLDCIIAPLVAFDLAGTRLGMGGGYYDRSLHFSLAQRGWRHPLLIGTAFDFQRVEHIQRQPWDVPLHCVVTEKSIYRFSR